MYSRKKSREREGGRNDRGNNQGRSKRKRKSIHSLPCTRLTAPLSELGPTGKGEVPVLELALDECVQRVSQLRLVTSVHVLYALHSRMTHAEAFMATRLHVDDKYVHTCCY